MTMDVSLEAPSDGKYKPTSPPAQTITLSNLSFIAESPNENEADLVEIRHKLRFEADSKISVMTILKLFLEQLMLLDSHAYLLSKDTSRHFQHVQDLPTAQPDLQKLFPATILHRRSGNRIVLRLNIICSQTFNELNRLGIITWPIVTTSASKKIFTLKTTFVTAYGLPDATPTPPSIIYTNI